MKLLGKRKRNVPRLDHDPAEPSDPARTDVSLANTTRKVHMSVRWGLIFPAPPPLLRARRKSQSSAIPRLPEK